MSPTKKVIVICGPTGAGKTDLAIKMALQYGTSIISADSRQCFRELNIGVAKPAEEQLNRVQHYFINSHSIGDEVDASVFEQYALQRADEIFAANDVVVMAGGTGLYVKAFLEGLDDMPIIPSDLRDEIDRKYRKLGLDWLQQELSRTDSRYASSGEMKNPQRMMRALEVILFTGKSILTFQNKEKRKRDFEVKKIYLNPERTELYERINLRVDKMMENGLLEEAEKLFPYRNLNALRTVGYQELFKYFNGELNLADAVELIKRNTRRYAKRQMTWFRKYFVDDDTEIR